MYIINYKNRIVEYPPDNGLETEIAAKPIEKLIDLTYEVDTEQQKDYWLDIITRTYGMYGEPTVSYRQIPPTEQQKIKLLEAQNEALKGETNLLTQCILELSASVYR